MNTHDHDQMRETAIELAKRAKADPTFKEQILQDPVKTLTAAGLPEEAVPTFLRETGMGDVSGYADQCLILTVIGCLVSNFTF